MPKFNTQFELSLEDMELIEVALRKKVAAEEIDCSGNPNSRELKHRVNDLLGRLHSQKAFYRPSAGTYVGG